jgi:hypothetical protein
MVRNGRKPSAPSGREEALSRRLRHERERSEEEEEAGQEQRSPGGGGFASPGSAGDGAGDGGYVPTDRPAKVQSVEEAQAFLQEMLESGGGIPAPAPPSTPLEEAQDLVYEAMTSTGKKRT